MARKQKTIPNRLHEIRQWREYNVQQATDLLGWGSTGTITKHEKGDGLNHENMQRYAAAYRVRISDITGETDFRDLEKSKDEVIRPRTISRATLRRELDEIDRESIRFLRAWLCRQKDAPNALVMLESRAEEIRDEIAQLGEIYDLTA